MAVVTNTRTTYDGAGRENREDLADLIDIITPEETPLYSMLSSEKADAVKVEWLTDINATPAENAKIEGDVYSYTATSQAVRIANYCQIFTKSVIVSETQEVVKKAGKSSEQSYQKAKMGAEIKTDIERSFVGNNASVAGAVGTARQSAGLRAFLATNDLMGVGGSSGGFQTGTGLVNAASNGTQRAFTTVLMDDAINAGYNSGGSIKIAMGSPYIKRVFSTFMSDANIAQLRTNVASKAATIVGAVDSYLSDFGLIDFVPNRQMAIIGASHARNVFFIDPAKVEKSVLRPIKEDKDVARTSDGTPIVMIGEMCLKVKNEAAHAVVADVFGMTAAS